MLTAQQVEELENKEFAANVRYLYFADLATSYSTQRQWITAISFFLSSGAVATIAGKLPFWVPLGFSVIAAGLTAYQLAFRLDGKIKTSSHLFSSWSQLEADLSKLRRHPDSSEASSELEAIIKRERELGEVATTETPRDEKRMERWRDYVLAERQIA